MSGYQVLSNHQIIDPSGHRFIVKGGTVFNYLFVSYESRTNYNFREKGRTTPPTGVSEPTYYAPTVYQNEGYVRDHLMAARREGLNLIRIAVEPAMMNASVPYVDPSDSQTYPSDIDMLDTIIGIAFELNLVVQLQNGNDAVPVADNLVFLAWLRDKYDEADNVWINPCNEINGTNADVENASVWVSQMTQYVNALRFGGNFTNPICIDPPGWATRIDLIDSELSTNPVFANDINLIVNVHFYPQAATLYTDDTSWVASSQYAVRFPQWVSYLGDYCIVVGECGIDNVSGRLDPDIDPGVPSVNLTWWANAQAVMSAFISWVNVNSNLGLLSGAIGHDWQSYIPGMGIHGHNTMRRTNGSRTAWGRIFRDKFISAPIDVPNTNLTGDDILALIGNLTSRVTAPGAGTPDFQYESTTGAKAGAVGIINAAHVMFHSFYNRATGKATGSISGDGAAGTVYSSVSDYRLKNIIGKMDNADAIEAFKQLKPVLAEWKDGDSPAELMFIAHEAGKAVPSAVVGDYDGQDGSGEPIYQTLDYGRITPLLAAILHIALEDIENLKRSKS